MSKLTRILTTAPWRVLIDDTGDEFSGYPSIQAPEELDIAIVHRAGFKQEFWGDLSQADAVAAAHLMSAAPELYWALNDLLNNDSKKNRRAGYEALAKAVNHPVLRCAICDQTWPCVVVHMMLTSSCSLES